MKRQALKSPPKCSIILQTLHNSIPQCLNQQQFFSLSQTRKKKRMGSLVQSVDNHKSLLSKMPHIDRKPQIEDERIMSFDCITSLTSSTAQTEGAIAFKQRQGRQKMNKNQFVDVYAERKFKPLHKKTLTSSITIEESQFCVRQPVLNPEEPNKIFTIHDFTVIRKIGQGTYSQVLLAVEKKTNWLCALKAIKKQRIEDQKLIDQIIRQLKIHHFLKHNNIVDLYGQFEDQHHLYLICELCTEGDLQKIKRHKWQNVEQFQVHQVAEIMRQLCSAVYQLHKNFLMHRDIKPENIFVTLGNRVKLGDFGWSVYYGEHGLRNTQCGTPFYLAPQLIECIQYSETVDIWALGVLAYELLVGQQPFTISQPSDLSKIVSQSIKFEYIENQSARDFVMKLLQRDTKLRLDIEDVLNHPFLKLAEIELD